jgi:hypothetical protein
MMETWLAARVPERPAALAEQMSRSLAACPASALGSANSVAHAMGLVGAWVLTSVNAWEPQSTEVALELLAADAFVTYAFEAATEENIAIGELAVRLLKEAA